MSNEVHLQKADGAKTIVSLPHLPIGMKLYVSNIGKVALEVEPGHDPIPPGETRLYEKHKSGTSVVVTKCAAPSSDQLSTEPIK